MFTRDFTHDTVTGTLRSRNRKTPILEALYRSYIREKYPDVKAAEFSAVTIASPPPSDHPAYLVLKEKYEQAMNQSVIENEIGWALFDLMGKFVQLASRLKSLSGVYSLDADGRMTKEVLLQAFEDYQNEDELWNVIEAELKELDKPLTLVELRPPEALTDSERNDPLSAAAD